MAKRTETTHLVVHCSATPPSMDIGAYEIDRMHRARGFFKIGYHAVIKRDGTIEYGRDWDEKGAHAVEGGFNHKSVGVCLVGGISENPQKHRPGYPWNGSDAEDNFTQEQRTALREVIGMVYAKYGRIPVIGHRDIPKVTKACPSFSVKKFMQASFPTGFDSIYPDGFPSRWED